jgi:hypothetical protein
MVNAFKGAACGLGGDDVTSALPWISATAGGASSSLIGWAHLQPKKREEIHEPPKIERAPSPPVEHVTISQSSKVNGNWFIFPFLSCSLY